MASFKDTSGKEWSISLNVATIRRVKELTSIDLTLPHDSASASADKSTLAQSLGTDVLMFVDVLCAICRPQMQAVKTVRMEGMTDEEFAEALGGQVIGDAQQAFFGEWADFFQNLRRPELAGAVKKTLSVLANVAAEAVGQLDRLEIALNKRMKDQLQEAGDRAIDKALKSIDYASGD